MESAAAGSVSHCTFQTISDYGWGCRRFVSHADVETSTATGEYLRNDCLVIRLPKLQSIRICVFSFNFDNHKKFSDAQADSELRPEQQVSSTLSEA